MSTLKEGQADTGHETHGQVCSFAPILLWPLGAAAHLSGYKEELPSVYGIWAATKNFQTVNVGEVIEQVPRKG